MLATTRRARRSRRSWTSAESGTSSPRTPASRTPRSWRGTSPCSNPQPATSSLMLSTSTSRSLPKRSRSASGHTSHRPTSPLVRDASDSGILPLTIRLARRSLRTAFASIPRTTTASSHGGRSSVPSSARSTRRSRWPRSSRTPRTAIARTSTGGSSATIPSLTTRSAPRRFSVETS